MQTQHRLWAVGTALLFVEHSRRQGIGHCEAGTRATSGGALPVPWVGKCFGFMTAWFRLWRLLPHDRHSNRNVPILADTESTSHKAQGLRRIVNALHYSLSGLRLAYRHEAAFRQEMFLACLLIVASFLLPVDGVRRALLVGSVFLVMIVELLNSAIEATVDHISLERHPLAKRAKDIGSAAVFMALMGCALVWSIVLFS